MFDGTAGRPIERFRSVGANFSVVVNGSLTSAGYLYAKTNVLGNLRYHSLYVTSTDIRLYYKPVDSAMRFTLVRFPASVLDGAAHQISMTVSGTRADLQVDGQPVVTRTLLAAVDDCSAVSSNCVLFVGQRSGGFPISGTLHSAMLYYEGGAAL